MTNCPICGASNSFKVHSSLSRPLESDKDKHEHAITETYRCWECDLSYQVIITYLSSFVNV